jgi:hypothetical protein
MADIKVAFGAKGDGRSDDTAAFELAVATIARKGTLLLPKGTYVITRVGWGGRVGVGVERLQALFANVQ